MRNCMFVWLLSGKSESLLWKCCSSGMFSVNMWGLVSFEHDWMSNEAPVAGGQSAVTQYNVSNVTDLWRTQGGSERRRERDVRGTERQREEWKADAKATQGAEEEVSMAFTRPRCEGTERNKEDSEDRLKEDEGGGEAVHQTLWEERATSKRAGVTELKWHWTEREQIALRVYKVTLSSELTQLNWGKNRSLGEKWEIKVVKRIYC